MENTFFVVTKVFGKRVWCHALLAVGFLIMIPLSVRDGLNFHGNLFYEGEGNPFDYFFSFISISWLLFIGISVYAFRDSRKFLFSLPLSSASMSSWLMLTTAGFVVFLSLLTNGLYRVFFFDQHWLSEYWPVLGPTLFVITLVFVGYGLYWNLQSQSILKLLFSAAVVVGLSWWFVSRFFPNGFQNPIVPWCRVTLAEYVTMLTVSLGAWWLGVTSFKRVRCGDAKPSRLWEQISLAANGFINGAQSVDAPVCLSKTDSLKQLHWRQSCSSAVRMVGIALAILLSVTILVSLMQSGPDLQLFHEATFTALFLFSGISGTLLGVFLGEGLVNKENRELLPALANAPFSDQVVASVLLRNLMKSIGVIFAFLLFSLAFGYLIAELFFKHDVIRWNQGQPVLQSVGLPALIALAVFWGIAANLVSLVWTGRNWFVISVFVCITALLCIGTPLYVFFVPRVWQPQVGKMVLSLLTLLVVSGSLTAFVMAFRMNLIRFRTVVGSALFVVVATLSFWNSWYSHPQHFRVFCSSLFLLLVLPFATIPLAVSWNRHR
ncbi:hypothetical protein [Gimesia panareensis]|uniref:hypothetical protein n=1 Tax=Gimesia panareensis TaxID=2527978 RepID=UPI001187C0AE|nr:hypothetical protein [Gimesia panareensis]QDU53415.1 hypothetical protein Pan110_58060 [Gimesia panareensis]